MAIQVVCPSCRGKFNAPDNAAGKRAKCPTCGGAIQIPKPAPVEEILDAEPLPASPYTDEDFEVEPPAALPATADTKPCPMCGETIQRNALKCRHCGEIFDPLLANALRKGGAGPSYGESADVAQDKTNAIVIFVTSILGCFSPIVAIYGIVFLLRRPYSFPLKWMAIVGTVLHCIWTAFLILSIAGASMQQ
jgi:predicted RNA-binding Zn-ribbon protein involved in translation (DUF1610 family)